MGEEVKSSCKFNRRPTPRTTLLVGESQETSIVASRQTRSGWERSYLSRAVRERSCHVAYEIYRLCAGYDAFPGC
jgi:hypothetical protein